MKLETKQSSTKSDHALAAANIRRELKAAFPAIKFAIRSSSYTGGDSIDIRWHLGPTEKQVEAISNKYQEGSFNGMIDLYEYDNDRTWSKTYGGSKYIHTRREYDSAHAIVKEALRTKYNAPSEYDLDTSAWRILSKYPLPAGATITGIEHNDTTCGLIEDIFRPTYTV